MGRRLDGKEVKWEGGYMRRRLDGKEVRWEGS